MEKDGAQAIVLACTELDMVVDVDANVLPIYDCTRIHARSGGASGLSATIEPRFRGVPALFPLSLHRALT